MLEWRKSSYSGDDAECVEIADLPGGAIGVRDTKDRCGPVLTLPVAAREVFLSGVANGEFDTYA